MQNLKKIFFLIPFFTGIILIGCSESPVDSGLGDTLNDRDAMLKLVEEDSVLSSFLFNYNEEDLMDFSFGKIAEEIYPVRVGQKMRVVGRDVDITVNGDTAYGTVTTFFQGMLIIGASYEPIDPTTPPAIDTVIRKPFDSQITRNVIFVKVRNTPNPRFNWAIKAISLPAGGVINDNISINKMTFTFPNGDSIEITSPNDYYFFRGPGNRQQVPMLSRNSNVIIRIELTSAYPDSDFVSLTYGSNQFGNQRVKKMFRMISSEFNGSTYKRVYERQFRTNMYTGPFHAIINAVPYQVLHDDATPVEIVTWGIPYFVR